MSLEKIEETTTTGAATHSNVTHIIFTMMMLVILLIPLIEDVYQAAAISTEEFIGKDQMLFFVNNTKYTVFKDQVFTNLFADQDGWLSYTGDTSLDDFQNTDLLTKSELKSIKEELVRLCTNMNRRGIRVVMVVPPNKNTIYEERLLSKIPRLKETSRLDQVLSVWTNTEDCTLLDLRAALMDAKQNAQVYNATDTHWNSLGAYIAYERIIRVVQRDFPQVVFHPLSDYTQSTELFKGDLGPTYGYISVEEEMVRRQPDFRPAYVLRSFGPVKSKGVALRDYTMTATGKPELPSAVVYRDSFFIHLFPFFADSFSVSHYFWTLNLDFAYVLKMKPDYLILESTERRFPEAISAWAKEIPATEQ